MDTLKNVGGGGGVGTLSLKTFGGGTKYEEEIFLFLSP